MISNHPMFEDMTPKLQTSFMFTEHSQNFFSSADPSQVQYFSPLKSTFWRTVRLKIDMSADFKADGAESELERERERERERAAAAAAAAAEKNTGECKRFSSVSSVSFSRWMALWEANSFL